MKQIKAICKHCGENIELENGRVWRSQKTLEPNYCWIDPAHGSQLHEPKEVADNPSESQEK